MTHTFAPSGGKSAVAKLTLRQPASVRPTVAPMPARERVLELEAERTADRVVRMAAPKLAAPTTCGSSAPGRCRCAKGRGHKALARTALPGSAGLAPPGPVATASGGAGSPLPQGVRGFFEPRFGRDFSGVRIHADSRAHALATRAHARAFTYGSDIVFARGEYDPHTNVGRRLLAHELTHVAQQDQAPPLPGATATAVHSTGPTALAAPPAPPQILSAHEELLKGRLIRYLGTVRRVAKSKPTGSPSSVAKKFLEPLWMIYPAGEKKIPFKPEEVAPLVSLILQAEVRDLGVLRVALELLVPKLYSAIRHANAFDRLMQGPRNRLGNPFGVVIPPLVAATGKAALTFGELMLKFLEKVGKALARVGKFLLNVLLLPAHIVVGVVNAIRTAVGFVRGVVDGLSVDRNTMRKIGTKLADPLVILSFPATFLAGAVVGGVKALAAIPRAIVDLLSDPGAFLGQLYDLLVIVFSSEGAEFGKELGHAMGRDLTKKISALSEKSGLGIAYGLGELAGPFLATILLSVLLPGLGAALSSGAQKVLSLTTRFVKKSKHVKKVSAALGWTGTAARRAGEAVGKLDIGGRFRGLARAAARKRRGEGLVLGADEFATLEKTKVMSGAQIAKNKGALRAELKIVGRSSPRRLTKAADGKLAKDYVAEVKLPNGKTWRLHKTGRWCRFSSPPTCFLDQDTGLHEGLDRVVKPPKTKAGQEGDVLNRHMRAAFARGQLVHNNYERFHNPKTDLGKKFRAFLKKKCGKAVPVAKVIDPIPGSMKGVTKERGEWVLRFGLRKNFRIDRLRLDETNHVVYEIKPKNSRYAPKHELQVNDYGDYMEEITGEKFGREILRYDAEFVDTFLAEHGFAAPDPPDVAKVREALIKRRCAGF